MNFTIKSIGKIIELVAQFAGYIDESDTDEWFVAIRDTPWQPLERKYQDIRDDLVNQIGDAGHYFRVKVCGPDGEIILEVT